MRCGTHVTLLCRQVLGQAHTTGSTHTGAHHGKHTHGTYTLSVRKAWRTNRFANEAEGHCLRKCRHGHVLDFKHIVDIVIADVHGVVAEPGNDIKLYIIN